MYHNWVTKRSQPLTSAMLSEALLIVEQMASQLHSVFSDLSEISPFLSLAYMLLQSKALGNWKQCVH